jgi:hypothetical protein
MIQVCNGHAKRILRSQLEQNINKGYRIGTAGYRNQNGVPVLNHAIGAKRTINRSVDVFFKMGILKIVVFLYHASIIIGKIAEADFIKKGPPPA